MKTLKIYPKYFQFIIDEEKDFEIRQNPIPVGEIVLLQEIDIYTKKPTGRTAQFTVASCEKIEWWEKYKGYITEKSGIFFTEEAISDGGNYYYDFFNNRWYDKFCWDYINNGKQTYLIGINKLKLNKTSENKLWAKYNNWLKEIHKPTKKTKEDRERDKEIEHEMEKEYDSRFLCKHKNESINDYRLRIIDWLEGWDKEFEKFRDSFAFHRLAQKYRYMLIEIVDPLAMAVDYLKQYKKYEVNK